MMREKLFDVFDHAKTGILGGLPGGSRLYVVPMWTMRDPIKKPELDLYRSLFGRQLKRVVKPRLTFRHKTRTEYFDQVLRSLGNVDDIVVFVDPDKGINPAKSRAAKEHIKLEEIRQILGSGDSRIVAVYQHFNRRAKNKTKKKERWEVSVLKRMCEGQKNQPQLYCFAWCGGMASLVFAAMDEAVLRPIHDFYVKWAGPQAKRRITRIYK